MVEHIEMKQQISAYIDGELLPAEINSVETHLTECASCQQYLQELKKISSSLRKIPNENLSPDLEQKINQQMFSKKSEGKNMNKTQLVLAGAIPSFIMALVLGLLVFQLYTKRAITYQLAQKASRAEVSTDKIVLVEKERKTDLAEKDVRTDSQLELTKAGELRMNAIGGKQSFSQMVKKSEAVGELAAANPKDTAPFILQNSAGARSAGRFKTFAEPVERMQAGEGFQRSSDKEYLNFPASQPVDQKFWSSQIAARQNESTGRALSMIVSSDYSYMVGAIETHATGLRTYVMPPYQNNSEEYAKTPENTLKDPSSDPLSTFSIDVDTASYANVRRFITSGQLPPKDAVRVEEMINYFDYDYPQPRNGEPFSVSTEIAACPWNTKRQLLMIGLQGEKIVQENVDSNLVFLIDVSGSMADDNKLPLLKTAMKLMVKQLKEGDRVSIVTYAGDAGVVLESTPGNEKEKILQAIDHLYSGGSTAGGAGIQLAYNIAKENFNREGNNRVILATDGDFNVGISSNEELVNLIEEKRDQGVYLTVLGFGTGNLKDSKMEQLADKGNGNYAYIDNILEAQKVLVHEMGSTLYTIAKDVKIQIEFNPDYVQSYKLIGYENRMLAKEDFNDDLKDASELGAGHRVTALYEIIPTGSGEDYQPVDGLKYQRPAAHKERSSSHEISTIKLRYKRPNEDKSRLITEIVTRDQIRRGKMSDNFQFASAVAEFGLLLRGSEYKGDASFENAYRRAKDSLGKDPEGYRSEFIRLIESARLLQDK